MSIKNPIDAASLDVYIREHLSDDSTYASTNEKRRDFAHSCYSDPGPDGELFRALVGEKISRTLAQGKTFPNVKSYESASNGGYASASSRHNPETGEIESMVSDQFNAKNPWNDPGTAHVSSSPGRSGPVIENLPGGNTRVTMRSGDAVRYGSKAERDAHDKYIAAAKAKQQRYKK